MNFPRKLDLGVVIESCENNKCAASEPKQIIVPGDQCYFLFKCLCFASDSCANGTCGVLDSLGWCQILISYLYCSFRFRAMH